MPTPWIRCPLSLKRIQGWTCPDQTAPAKRSSPHRCHQPGWSVKKHKNTSIPHCHFKALLPSYKSDPWLNRLRQLGHSCWQQYYLLYTSVAVCCYCSVTHEPVEATFKEDMNEMQCSEASQFVIPANSQLYSQWSEHRLHTVCPSLCWMQEWVAFVLNIRGFTLMELEQLQVLTLKRRV